MSCFLLCTQGHLVVDCNKKNILGQGAGVENAQGAEARTGAGARTGVGARTRERARATRGAGVRTRLGAEADHKRVVTTFTHFLLLIVSIFQL